MMSELEVLQIISNLDCPDKGFNFKSDDGVLWGKDKDGHISFAFYSINPNATPLIQSTQYLKLYINSPFVLRIEDKTLEKNLSAIVLTNNDEKYIDLFVKLTSTFSRNVDEVKLLNYFIRLKDLFANSKKMSNYELQGLFGEFFTMYYFAENYNVDISPYYQREQKRKFDFSITEKKKIEIKTTLKANRIHHFLQMQLDTDRYDIKVISIMLQKDDKGMSLYDLMTICEKSFSDNFDLIFQINKIKKNNAREELDGIRFNSEYASSLLRVFDACKMPRLKERNDDGIFNVEYDCDLENVESMNAIEIINWLNK